MAAAQEMARGVRLVADWADAAKLISLPASTTRPRFCGLRERPLWGREEGYGDRTRHAAHWVLGWTEVVCLSPGYAGRRNRTLPFEGCWRFDVGRESAGVGLVLLGAEGAWEEVVM